MKPISRGPTLVLYGSCAPYAGTTKERRSVKLIHVKAAGAAFLYGRTKVVRGDQLGPDRTRKARYDLGRALPRGGTGTDLASFAARR
jgi:hypothetical protein